VNIKYWLCQAMTRQGGDFVKALGKAMMFADPDNYARFVTAYPDIVDKYSVIAAELKQEDDAKP
jgi:hypothetical protein